MLDYFEGRLNAKQSAELMSFLELHPEWKAEFEAFDESEETPEVKPEESTTNTSTLRLTLLQESRDEDLIALLEGQLNPQDSRRLLKEIERDEELAGDFALYQLAKVKPDFTIEYPNKSKLRKSASVRVLLFRYAAVAALLFGAFVAGWMYFNSTSTPNVTNRVANTPVISTEKSRSVEPAISSLSDQNEQGNSQSLTDEFSDEDNQKVPQSNVEERDQAEKPTPAPHQETIPSKPEPREREEVLIAALDPVGITNLSHATPAWHIGVTPTRMGSSPAAPSPEWLTEDESTGLGGLLGNIGQSVLGRLKNAAGENVTVEQKETPEEELYTSTFKLGSFEVYRSRTKK